MPHFLFLFCARPASTTTKRGADSFGRHAPGLTLLAWVGTEWIKPPRALTFQPCCLFLAAAPRHVFWRGPRWRGGGAQAWPRPWLCWRWRSPCGSGGAAGVLVPAPGIWTSPHALIQAPGRSRGGSGAAGFGTSSSCWKSTPETNRCTSAR